MPTNHTQAPPALRGAPVAVGGLYIHVPFCFHKCHYCDFYTVVQGRDPRGLTGAGSGSNPAADRQRAFVDRLIAELRHRAGQCDLRPRTVFVGGGTPTLLHPALWRRLLDAMRRGRLLDRVIEFTVEANPETVTPRLMQVLAQGGVNRISLGAQSFDAQLLKTLERRHRPARVRRSMRTIRRAGINNVNLDLIYAIPGQTLDVLRRDLDEALALGPEHLSCYGLSFEPNTAMLQRLKLGRLRLVDEPTQRRMFERVIDRLGDAGYEHYEISNWARPGYRCDHNLLYWTNGDWLGAGPAASSHVGGQRWKNRPHMGDYLSTTPEAPTADFECLGKSESLGEQLMLRLRLIEGVPLDWLNTSVPAGDRRWAGIEQLIRIGMLQRTAGHLRLTRKGLFVADAVIAELL